MSTPRISHAVTLVVGLIAGGTALHPRIARAADLATIVEQSLDRDAELAQARAGYEAARQAVPQARAALLPQLSGGWGRTYNRIATEDFPRTDYWQNGWMVSLSQPLFDWGKWTAYQQADFVEAHGAAEFSVAKQTAMLRAVRAYFDTLTADDELRRTTDYLAAIDAQLTEARRKHAAGEATVIDLRDAETALAQARLQQMDAQHDVLAKRRAIEQLTGEPFAPLSRLPDAMTLPALYPENADAWADQAQDQNYDVQLKQLEVEIAKYDAKKIHAEHFPVVAATASYSPAGAASGYSRPTTTTTAMLSVSVPIFSGGDIQAREKASLALADKAQDAQLAASRQAESAARDDYARYQLERARSDSLARLVQETRDTLSATQIGYKVGSRTSVDVLRAIDSLYTAKRDLTRARYDAVVTLLQLKADTATLTVDDIAQINLAMNPGNAALAHADAARPEVDARGAAETRLGTPINSVVGRSAVDAQNASVPKATRTELSAGPAPIAATATRAHAAMSAPAISSAAPAEPTAIVTVRTAAVPTQTPALTSAPLQATSPTPTTLPNANLPNSGIAALKPIDPTALQPL